MDQSPVYLISMKKPDYYRNYTPHSKWEHTAREATQEYNYYARLFAEVCRACSRFFADRGIVDSRQNAESVRYNNSTRKKKP